jgi:hypothetical protein
MNLSIERRRTMTTNERNLVLRVQANVPEPVRLIRKLDSYPWFSEENYREAVAEFNHGLTNLRNGWRNQALRNVHEIFDVYECDRVERNVSILMRHDPRNTVRVLRFPESIDTAGTITLPFNRDFNVDLVPIEASTKRVPARFSDLVDRLNQSGGGFDKYWIAEPVRKPQPPIDYEAIRRIERDPWLVGQCGRYVAIIGGWA